VTIGTLEALFAALRDAGATRVLAKRLAENDNSKQQVYLGGGFSALNLLPFGEVLADSSGKSPTMKAALALSWLSSEGHEVPAPGTQLILYPGYPEVRMSGFLRGCSASPAGDMRPVPAAQRKFDNGPDGRVLFLAVHPSRRVIAYLATAGSRISRELDAYVDRRAPPVSGVFLDIQLEGRDARGTLLARLREIHSAGWHDSRRLDSSGTAHSYVARNGAGYTLEALFGITPNGRAQPDYLGWELKACGSDRITLMTPEPDSGFYGENGVEAFVREYGRRTEGDTLYFTGQHRVDQRCVASGLTLSVHGFDAGSGKIVDVDGGLFLLGDDGSNSAGWSFSRLLKHWGRKHAAAAYVPYKKSMDGAPRYRYLSPASLGEGTEFVLFLRALIEGAIVYDPGSKVMAASTRGPKTQARSQFRISKKRLAVLYKRFDDEPIDRPRA
jgi:hypothetical protein